MINCVADVFTKGEKCLNTFFYLTILIIGFVCSFFLGIVYRKLKAEKMISSAECEAKKIVDAAKEMAETKKKEVILEGKDEVHKIRSEAEKEIAERRRDVQRQERRGSEGRKSR